MHTVRGIMQSAAHASLQWWVLACLTNKRAACTHACTHTLAATQNTHARTPPPAAPLCRLLRPGGVMAIMEMNPASPAFQRVFSNAFAYTAFKSTEPWLMEYVTLDLAAALTGAGFEAPLQAENSPRHRTVVALKPRA